MKIRALGEQLTFYDDDGNVIGHDPPLPPEDPDEEVRMINIVEFEDRLMGIDPNQKPDFFIDVEEQRRYARERKPGRLKLSSDTFAIDMLVFTMLALALVFIFSLFGYMMIEDIVEKRMASM